jgi:hypothetical protein
LLIVLLKKVEGSFVVLAPSRVKPSSTTAKYQEFIGLCHLFGIKSFKSCLTVLIYMIILGLIVEPFSFCFVVIFPFLFPSYLLKRKKKTIINLQV